MGGRGKEEGQIALYGCRWWGVDAPAVIDCKWLQSADCFVFLLVIFLDYNAVHLDFIAARTWDSELI